MGDPASEQPRRTIKRRKLYEEVAAELEAMILSGEYAPGDQLPSERKIMEEFGVGRPAVREALFALQKMGLVSVQSGGPARVTKPTPHILINELSGAARLLLTDPEGVRTFQDARLLFEMALARRAAEQATEEELQSLKASLDANRKAIDDPKEFARTDVAFHYGISVMARNPIFSALNEGLSEWLSEQRHISMRSPGSAKAAVRAHTRIYKAIAARDPDQAERAMRTHLEEVARRYWEVVASETGNGR